MTTRKQVLKPPIRNLWATVAWDTWWPDSREVLVFESRRAAEKDAKRLDPGWRAVVYRVSLGEPFGTRDGDPAAPYDENEDAA